MESYEDHVLPSPPQIENTVNAGNELAQPTPQELTPTDPSPEADTSRKTQPTTHFSLQPPSNSLSRNGYEDMTRLKRAWTKPEVTVDKKGYVMINPVKRPASPSSSPTLPATSPKPLAVSSMLYENFIPLKTQPRNFEVRRVPPTLPRQESENAGSPSSSNLEDSKPEKPTRHSYENLDIHAHHAKEGKLSGYGQREVSFVRLRMLIRKRVDLPFCFLGTESAETRHDTKEDSNESM
jgi:hypothetical protein